MPQKGKDKVRPGLYPCILTGTRGRRHRHSGAEGSPRPTIRSRAAILASYSCIRSAACTSSFSAPASNLPTQIRINYREMSCRRDSPGSISPARNASVTCRLKAARCDRCFVMAFILRKPTTRDQFKSSVLSTPRGALHRANCVPTWVCSPSAIRANVSQPPPRRRCARWPRLPASLARYRLIRFRWRRSNALPPTEPCARRIQPRRENRRRPAFPPSSTAR